MMELIGFFDAGLLRLIFTLLVDYLITAGFLLPEQRQQWVDGWGHVIGIAGGVIFMAIWQYHSHKKDLLKQPVTITKTSTEITQPETTTQSVSQYLPGNEPEKNTP